MKTPISQRRMDGLYDSLLREKKSFSGDFFVFSSFEKSLSVADSLEKHTRCSYGGTAGVEFLYELYSRRLLRL